MKLSNLLSAILIVQGRQMDIEILDQRMIQFHLHQSKILNQNIGEVMLKRNNSYSGPVESGVNSSATDLRVAVLDPVTAVAVAAGRKRGFPHAAPLLANSLGSLCKACKPERSTTSEMQPYGGAPSRSDSRSSARCWSSGANQEPLVEQRSRAGVSDERVSSTGL